MNKIKISNYILEKIEYQGVPVITVGMIGRLHNKKVFVINQHFQRNKKHFIENQDYFRITICDLENTELKLLFKSNNQKEVYLFTETGYLMLVKTFRDVRSWNIQRELVKTYFKVKQLAKQDIDRAIEKASFKSLMQSVKDFGENERMGGHGYSNYNNLIYKLVFGMNAKQFKKEHEINKSDTVKDHITPANLKMIELLERAVDNLLRFGFEYSYIKEELTRIYQNVNMKKLEGK